MICSDLDQKLYTFDHSTDTSTITGTFLELDYMMSKSILGVEMMKNRGPNVQQDV